MLAYYEDSLVRLSVGDNVFTKGRGGDGNVTSKFINACRFISANKSLILVCDSFGEYLCSTDNVAVLNASCV